MNLDDPYYGLTSEERTKKPKPTPMEVGQGAPECPVESIGQVSNAAAAEPPVLPQEANEDGDSEEDVSLAEDHGVPPEQLKLPADSVCINEGGPLSVVFSHRQSGQPPMHTVHFLCTSGSKAGRTAGCNRALTAARHTPIPESSVWDEISHKCTLCKFCARLYTIPKDWSWNEVQVDEEHLERASASSSGEASSQATDSESENSSMET